MTTHNPTGTVPAIDSASNDTGLDVIGNKDDTAAGDSLAARLVVPATNSVDNDYISDVVGSKLDRAYTGGNSIYALQHVIAEHSHSRSYVLPDRATAITATAGNGWAYGAASASLGTPAFAHFDIHWLDVVAGNNAEYQVRILIDGVVATEMSFERISPVTRSVPVPVQTAIFAAGPVTIQLASSLNGATATFKVNYHPY